MKAKSFPLAAVLSITTGHLLCPLGEVHALLRHMTGAMVYSRQLPRLMDACRPWLLHWFPALRDVNTRGLNALLKRQPEQRAVEAWLAQLLCDLPATYNVSPMPQEAHDRPDPIVVTDKEPPHVA